MKLQTIKRLSRNMVYRAIFLVCIFPALITQCQADILWDYLSTDGTDTVTGQLTTAGNSADALISGNTFSLISIEFTVLNGTLIEAWFEDVDPPFTFNVEGALTTTGSGVASISVAFDSISAEGITTFAANSRIRLGASGGSTTTTSRFESVTMGDPEVSHYSFEPTSTTFTLAVPEPGSFLILGLVGLGLLRRKRLIAIRDPS